MPVYESIYILRPSLSDEEAAAAKNKIEGIIKENAGKILDDEKWGKRKLAYEVAKERYGFYILIHFESEAKLIAELERNYKLMGDVMKYIIIRLNKKELAKWEADKKEKKVEEKAEK